MSKLPLPELIIFAVVIASYLAAAVAGILQLLAGGEKYKRFLLPLVALAVTLEAVILIFRAVAIKAVPLTGLFESMIVLTIVFGLTYLFLSIPIHRVWFSSVMVWVMLVLILLAAIVASPASQASEMASTPWAIAHAISMILAAASAMLATAGAVLYLYARRKLKRKDLLGVLGKMPNVEKLEHMNLLGIRLCFILLTFGLVSGIGLSVSLKLTSRAWLTDPKIVLIEIIWLLLGVILVLLKTARLKERTIAQLTIVTFALLLFAVVGTSVFCGTRHDSGFGTNNAEAGEQTR
jgi:ABC-type transport system involved in cytochrome c biogenesis permease subunit